MCSPTYPWVGTDAAVESSIVAGDGKSVDQRLCELWRLLEVAVVVLRRFHLQACWGKGKGMGLCMILTLIGIMWGIAYVHDEGNTTFLYLSSAETETPTFKGLSVIAQTPVVF